MLIQPLLRRHEVEAKETTPLYALCFCPVKICPRRPSNSVNNIFIEFDNHSPLLRVVFSEYRESEDTHEKSIFLLFHQNIPLGELIHGKIA